MSALPTNVVTCVFDLKQSKLVADRWTFAKVTTHNLVDTNLTVTAEFYTKGTKLIITNKGYEAWLMEDKVGINVWNGLYKVSVLSSGQPAGTSGVLS